MTNPIKKPAINTLPGKLPQPIVIDAERAKKINNVTAFNMKRQGLEALAKNDSVIAASKARFAMKDVIDQRRAGNAAANMTRVASKIPQVFRGRTVSGSSSSTDKYGTTPYNSTAYGHDSYRRLTPLEKNHERVTARQNGGPMADTRNKKKPTASPYGSDKINIDSSGNATQKTYPKTRTMGVNKTTGKETITVTDTNKKVLYHKDNVGANGAKESNRFKSDSTAYAKNADYQAEKHNIGKAASSPSTVNGKALRLKPVIKSKKGMKMESAKDDCGCGSGKMHNGGSMSSTRVMQSQAAGARQNWPSAVALANGRSQQAARIFARGGGVPDIDEESPIRHRC